MENQSRIEELLTESLRISDRILDQLLTMTTRADSLDVRLDVLTTRVDHLNEAVKHLNDNVGRLSSRMKAAESEIKDLKNEVARLNGEMAKLNLTSAENLRALMKLADNAERIDRLERTVFKKIPGNRT